MKNERFLIEGMSCQHCIMAVRKELEKLDLNRVVVALGSAAVDYDETRVTRAQIVAAISEAGYTVV